ncbi:MAG: amidohydrolase family protein, partial [Cyclobacteriaceae bacterium]
KRLVACITDGISGMGLPDGTYTYNNREYTSINGLARYLDGTLIGSTMGLGKISANFIKFTGAGFREAIDCVSINPARILGIDKYKGSIEAGKDADIVIIDENFNVKYTIISGRTIYQN